jgi:hypothetical protein
MASLENLKPNCQVKGILKQDIVTILSVQWHGSDVVEVSYRGTTGQLGNELIFRDREADLDITAPGTAWVFDADPEMFRLVSEAYRIRMAYLFDPWLAIHYHRSNPSSPITAVYGEMLPRQPLRFCWPMIPGAGKTIMTGLFIKELLLRVTATLFDVSPGNLTEHGRMNSGRNSNFPLIYSPMTKSKQLDPERTGETPLVIARLDKLSRDEELQARLANRIGI